MDLPTFREATPTERVLLMILERIDALEKRSETMCRTLDLLGDLAKLEPDAWPRAARTGDLEALELMIRRYERSGMGTKDNCGLVPVVFKHAAAAGRLDVLEWANERGLLHCSNGPWLALGGIEYATDRFSPPKKDPFAVLDWLHRMGFEFGKQATDCAVRIGDIALLTWLANRGTVFEQKAYLTAIFAERRDIVEWLRDDRRLPLSASMLARILEKDTWDRSWRELFESIPVMG